MYTVRRFGHRTRSTYIVGREIKILSIHTNTVGFENSHAVLEEHPGL